MNTLRICGLLAALALAVSAMAYPTLMGPTGQAVIPTAMTAGSGFTVAADYQSFEAGHEIPIRALFGIGQNLEVGASYATFSDDVNFTFNKAWDANAKYAFATLLSGKAAIGAQYMNIDLTTDATAKISQGYLAWTRNMTLGEDAEQALGITLGANWTQIKVAEEDFSENGIRYFAGLDLMLTPMFSVLADYQTKRSEFEEERAISAVTARIQLNRMIALQLGSTNAIGPIGTDKHNFFAGLEARFGGSAE